MTYSAVVQSNHLVESSYKLKINELRLVLFCLTKVYSKEAHAGAIIVYPEEFSSHFDLQELNVHNYLKSAINTLKNKQVLIKGKSSSKSINWLVEGEYINSRNTSAHIRLEFSPEMTELISGLDGNFTKLKFENIKGLNTLYSFRLYQLLKQKEKFLNHKRNGRVVVELKLEWMKGIAGLQNSYQDWREFKRRVIVPALKKINYNTDIDVVFKPQKIGKCVVGVEFSYTCKKRDEAFKLPCRPRIKKRPRVAKGSHGEGVWARNNLSMLGEYELVMQNAQGNFKLPKKDIERCFQYAKIIGDSDAKKYYSSQLT